MQTENEQPQAVETAEKSKKQKKKKTVGQEILSWVLTILAAVAIALVIRTFIFEPVRVDGHSMDDTLANNEVMFVGKLNYLFGQPQRGDVVICHYPDPNAPEENRKQSDHFPGMYLDENFVKRLIAVPGDTVEVRANVVYVNGDSIDEPYLTSDRNNDGFSMDPITLGEDEYFVMGDNRDNSRDCRNYYGYGHPTTLKRSQIIGHVRFVIFPFNQMRGIQ